MSQNQGNLSIVMVGEVDHGKSSVVGRLLDETGAISRSRIEAVRKICEDQGKEFEHAFLLDAFEEEQRQGITIDVSYFLFATPKRRYRLIDAPGHHEFLKNMVSGSSAADAAILLIDAKEGASEQSRRHSYLLKLLGIRQILVAVNKMDLVGYSFQVYEAIRAQHHQYLESLGLESLGYIPMSAKLGRNISRRGGKELDWYQGPTLLEALDLLVPRRASGDAPLRIAVQDVYKFDERRVVAGRVDSGRVAAGDGLKSWPSGRAVKVGAIERWNAPGAPASAEAGESIGLALTEQVFVERGDILAPASSPPAVTTLMDATLFWMGKTPLARGVPVRLKLLTQEVDAQVFRIHGIIDTSSLAKVERGESGSGITEVARHEVADVTLQLTRPVALDAFSEVPESGRFVIVDGSRVSGGGIVISPVSNYAQIAKPVSTDIAWEFSRVTTAERSARNGHRGAVLWFTGLSGSGKSTLAKLVERELFRRGCQCFVLDGDNLRHGLNADIGFTPEGRKENIRRAGEVAKLFADAGNIVITAFISPFREDRDRLRKIFPSGTFLETYVSCPLDVCESRDPKGLYRRARAGLLKDFTGISSPFEEPEHPELKVDTSLRSPEECLADVVRCLEESGVFRV